MFASEDQYGIVDGHYNGNEAILRNFQKGKKTKRMWKGTLEEATALCSLLNRDKTVAARAVKQDMSATQKRYYSSKPRPTRARNMPAFKVCACGARYKGDKHCD
jgi:hypothetical protein